MKTVKPMIHGEMNKKPAMDSRRLYFSPCRRRLRVRGGGSAAGSGWIRVDVATVSLSPAGPDYFLPALDWSHARNDEAWASARAACGSFSPVSATETALLKFWSIS